MTPRHGATDATTSAVPDCDVGKVAAEDDASLVWSSDLLGHETKDRSVNTVRAADGSGDELVASIAIPEALGERLVSLAYLSDEGLATALGVSEFLCVKR